MMLDVKEVLKHPGKTIPVSLDVPPGAISLGDHAPVLVALHFEGRCVGEDQASFVVEGRLDIRLETECSRCLKPVIHPMSIEVDELCRRNAGEHDEAFSFSGSELDLGALLVMAVHLVLPMQFLCKEDCSGLCPYCGVDRNEKICDCAPKKPNAFAALLETQSKNEEV